MEGGLNLLDDGAELSNLSYPESMKNLLLEKTFLGL